MTPEQAVANLDATIADLQLGRQLHWVLQQRIAAVYKALEDQKKCDTPPPSSSDSPS